MKAIEEKENSTVDLGRGNGALWTIAGTAIAMTAKELLRPGALGGIFGGNPPPGGAPVTREVLDLTTRNQALESKLYAQELNTPQLVWNAKQEAEIRCLGERVARLESLTQVVVPNRNVAPGWGPAFVAPGVPPPPPLDSATIQAIASAVAAQTAKEAA